MDIFHYWEIQKETRCKAERRYEELERNTGKETSSIQRVVERYTGRKTNQENLEAMFHDLCAAGLSGDVARMVVEEIRIQYSVWECWDGTLDISVERPSSSSIRTINDLFPRYAVRRPPRITVNVRSQPSVGLTTGWDAWYNRQARTMCWS